MADNKLVRGSFSTLTCTLANLASSTSGVGRRSTAFDNSSLLAKDLEFEFVTRSNSSGTSATGYVHLYIYQSADGTTYETGGSTDAAHTVVPGSLIPVRPLPVVANSTSYAMVFRFSEFAGFYAPYHAGLVVVNTTGANLDNTGGNHSIRCRGLYESVA